jgi:GntR family transcriptional regulator
VLDQGTPLYLQIGAQLADEIADGTLAEGERVPSSNEFAAYHRINPATAAKGINVLIDEGLLEKRRGIGMFVAAGARERLLAVRRRRFAEQYVEPLLIEGQRLGLGTDALVSLIEETSQRNREASP